MKVGTFEGLLAMSDDLGRADSYCEGVVRKTERQIADTYLASKAAESARGRSSAGTDAAAAPPPLPLTVNGVPVTEYLRRWTWDFEAWDPRDPLPDLVKRILAAAERVDSELRSYASAYGEKRTQLTALERRRDGNLLVRGLEDVITPQALQAARAEIVSGLSEYLHTYVLVVPKAGEEAFLASYEGLAAEAVPYGPEGRRDAVHGSPVVPGSARRIAEDREGYVLYLVTALRKYEDALRAALKERRYTLRDFTFDPAAAGTGARAIADLEADAAGALAHLREQAQRKYGEAVSLWLHLKAVRLFVEGVLRYGLPARYEGPARSPFAGVLVSCARGKQRAVLEAVTAAWGSIAGSQARSLLDDVYGDGASKGVKGAFAEGPLVMWWEGGGGGARGSSPRLHARPVMPQPNAESFLPPSSPCSFPAPCIFLFCRRGGSSHPWRAGLLQLVLPLRAVRL